MIRKGHTVTHTGVCASMLLVLVIFFLTHTHIHDARPGQVHPPTLIEHFDSEFTVSKNCKTCREEPETSSGDHVLQARAKSAEDGERWLDGGGRGAGGELVHSLEQGLVGEQLVETVKRVREDEKMRLVRRRSMVKSRCVHARA